VEREEANYCRPISEAPVKDGEVFGPCLLGPGSHGEEWTIGGWDGNVWFDADGITIVPLVYLYLRGLEDVLLFLGLNP
jgi:hypothetical protein